MIGMLFPNTTFVSVGAEVDQERVELLLSQVAGKDITELIAAGREKLASVPAGGGAVAVSAPSGGGGGAAPAAAAETKKEEKVEEKEESDDVSCQYLFTFSHNLDACNILRSQPSINCPGLIIYFFFAGYGIRSLRLRNLQTIAMATVCLLTLS